MKIGQKVFISFLFLSLIPLGSILYYISVIYSRQLEENIAQNQEMICESNAENVKAFLEKLEFTSDICYDWSVQKLLESPSQDSADLYNRRNSLMSNFNIKMDMFHVANMVDSIEIITAYDDIYQIKGSQIENADDLDILDLTDLRKYQKILLNHSDGKLVYVRRIRSLEQYGKYLGTIYITFDFGRLLDKNQSETQDDSIYYEIVNNNEKILYTNNIYNKSLKKYDRYIYNFEDYGIKLRYYYNNAKIMNSVTYLEQITIKIMLISVIVIVIASILLTNDIVRPIKEFQQRVRKAKHGYYEWSSEESSYPGEIGEFENAFNDMLRQINHLINEVYQKELREKDAVIETLMAQINPHFLYNTLDMIKSMAEIEDQDEIGEMVKALSSIFRYSTYSRNPLVTVDEEITNLKNYIRIIQARFGNKVHFEINVDEEVHQYSIIKLCLQPLVENSVKHGIFQKSCQGKVNIQIYKKENQLYVCVKDNGSGMLQEDLQQLQKELNCDKIENEKRGVKIGLYNINTRLKLYYGKEYGLKISNNVDAGLKIEFCIPCKLTTEVNQ